MNNSADITNIEADSTAAEYGGYSPKNLNDFAVREDSGSPLEEDTPQAPLLDPGLTKDEPKDHLFSMAAIAVCLILFIIFLTTGAAVPCKVGLCGKIDRSSTLQTSYNFEVYDFEAPFKFAWGAFAVFTLACAVFSLYNFVLCKKETGDEGIKQIAAYIRKSCQSFLIKQLVLLLVVLVGLFILVGVGYSMRAAGCLAFGAIAAIMTCATTVMVATAGNIRAAVAARQSRSQGMTVELRTATIITVASYSFAIGGPALSYLIFRDVRALSGYVIGAVTVTLFVRISGGIFYRAANIGRDPTSKGPTAFGSNRNNPTVLADNVGTIVGKVVGESLHTFAAFTIAVVATSILATSFPYFGDNDYAVCMFNHMEVDHTCTGFREPRKKLSFAASICRANAFYTNFPSLSVWASNSSFVAVPFILGFTGLLGTIVCTAYRSTPSNADVAGGNEEVKQKMKPFVTRVWINVAIAAVLTIACGASVCFGLFGNNSSFFKENTIERDVYTIPAMTAENAATRCRPLETQGDNLAKLPLLELSKRGYQTRDSFGEMFPKASETGWRLFVCALLGVVLGVGLGVVHGLVASVSRSPAYRVAENGEYGASAVLVEGLGVSFLCTFGSFAVVLILVLGCYGLYGAYGIGVSSLAMLSMTGPIAVMSLYDAISSSANGINGAMMWTRTEGTSRKTDAFETVGKTFSAVWKGLVNTGLALGVVALLFVVVQESNLVPSSRQLGGTVRVQPSRHVTDVDETSVTEMYVLVSTILGVLTPLVFSAAVTLGMRRTWERVLGVARRRAESEAEYERCTRVATVGSVVETVIPGMVAIVGPLVVGFWFGQRALVGMVTGVVWMSLMLSQGLCTAGGIWESGERVVAMGGCGREHVEGRWRRAMTGGEGVGRGLADGVGGCVMIAAAEVCSVSVCVVGLMRRDQSGWWIGLVLMLLFGICGMAMVVVIRRRMEGEMEEKDQKVIVDRRGMSPFFEEGPSIIREHINPESDLGPERTNHHQCNSSSLMNERLSVAI